MLPETTIFKLMKENFVKNQPYIPYLFGKLAVIGVRVSNVWEEKVGK